MANLVRFYITKEDILDLFQRKNISGKHENIIRASDIIFKDAKIDYTGKEIEFSLITISEGEIEDCDNRIKFDFD